jgi:hypothetical protein
MVSDKNTEAKGIFNAHKVELPTFTKLHFTQTLLEIKKKKKKKKKHIRTAKRYINTTPLHPPPNLQPDINFT